MKKAYLITLVLWMTPGIVWAQENIAAKETTIPGGTLAMAAYVALWFMLLGYFILLTTRLRKIREDVRTLESRIDDLFED